MTLRLRWPDEACRGQVNFCNNMPTVRRLPGR
jgi:hypothetical protein